MTYSVPKGAARLAVESAMTWATEKTPLTVDAIVEMTGLSPTVVRVHIGNMVFQDAAYNMNAGRKHGQYVNGSKPKEPANFPTERFVPTGYYCGKELTAPPAREAGLHAYTIGSLTAGKVTPRSRPISLSSPVTV